MNDKWQSGFVIVISSPAIASSKWEVAAFAQLLHLSYLAFGRFILFGESVAFDELFWSLSLALHFFLIQGVEFQQLQLSFKGKWLIESAHKERNKHKRNKHRVAFRRSVWSFVRFVVEESHCVHKTAL